MRFDRRLQQLDFWPELKSPLMSFSAGTAFNVQIPSSSHNTEQQIGKAVQVTSNASASNFLSVAELASSPKSLSERLELMAKNLPGFCDTLDASREVARNRGARK